MVLLEFCLMRDVFDKCQTNSRVWDLVDVQLSTRIFVIKQVCQVASITPLGICDLQQVFANCSWGTDCLLDVVHKRHVHSCQHTRVSVNSCVQWWTHRKQMHKFQCYQTPRTSSCSTYRHHIHSCHCICSCYYNETKPVQSAATANYYFISIFIHQMLAVQRKLQKNERRIF